MIIFHGRKENLLEKRKEKRINDQKELIERNRVINDDGTNKKKGENKHDDKKNNESVQLDASSKHKRNEEKIRNEMPRKNNSATQQNKQKKNCFSFKIQIDRTEPEQQCKRVYVEWCTYCHH